MDPMLKFYFAVTISMLCLLVAQWSYRFFIIRRCKHGIALSQILFVLSHGVLLLYGWHSTQRISSILAAHPVANKVQMEYLTHALDITTPSGTKFTFYRSGIPTRTAQSMSGTSQRIGRSDCPVRKCPKSDSGTGRCSAGLQDSYSTDFADFTLPIGSSL
jgi:hypothetical protein